MTKYLLHGGTKKAEGVYLRDEEFMHDMLRFVGKKSINLLLCYFAKAEDRWPDLLRDDKTDFSRIAHDCKINFEVANQSKITDQIMAADVVYLRGGDGHRIKSMLHPIPNLASLFGGKVVGACSAGVNVLAKYYWDNDYQQIEEGLAVLPIKTICHYRDDLQGVGRKLSALGEQMQLIELPEDEYYLYEI